MATATGSKTETSAAPRPPPKTHDHEGVNFRPSLGGQLWAVVDSSRGSAPRGRPRAAQVTPGGRRRHAEGEAAESSVVPALHVCGTRLPSAVTGNAEVGTGMDPSA